MHFTLLNTVQLQLYQQHKPNLMLSLNKGIWKKNTIETDLEGIEVYEQAA